MYEVSHHHLVRYGIDALPADGGGHRPEIHRGIVRPWVALDVHPHSTTQDQSRSAIIQQQD